ncbi:MAG: hypothetical protein DRQ97_00330 [Gammaproteobacteria bacterium]|nr:MAG: hypothetical protein DRQ97_00330 [Gammaproteobacteria bacterium]
MPSEASFFNGWGFPGYTQGLIIILLITFLYRLIKGRLIPTQALLGAVMNRTHNHTPHHIKIGSYPAIFQ